MVGYKIVALVLVEAVVTHWSYSRECYDSLVVALVLVEAVVTHWSYSRECYDSLVVHTCNEWHLVLVWKRMCGSLVVLKGETLVLVEDVVAQE